MHASHRRCSVVIPRLCAVEKRPEIVLQILRVLIRGLTVHSHGSVFAHTSVRLAHPIDIDMVRERLQTDSGLALRQLRYPFEFR
jgi:EAL domain-containing protein (putative c-di-GMP-specific phosphodiesterase class I)